LNTEAHLLSDSEEEMKILAIELIYGQDMLVLEWGLPK
jgi:hypothetical protein